MCNGKVREDRSEKGNNETKLKNKKKAKRTEKKSKVRKIEKKIIMKRLERRKLPPRTFLRPLKKKTWPELDRNSEETPGNFNPRVGVAAVRRARLRTRQLVRWSPAEGGRGIGEEGKGSEPEHFYES